MERKTHSTTSYGKARKGRRKSRPEPYNTNRLDQRGSLTTTVRRSVDPLVIQPWMPLFPARAVRRLRYCDSITLTTTSGSVGSYVLRANDLFDPDFTGTGHQPMGFDQMMVFYNHFTVTKARLVCTFENGVNAASVCSVRVDADSTPLTAPTRIVEMGGNVMVDCENKTTSSATRTVELSVDIAKYQGVSRSAITSDPSLQGSSAASPLECTYFHVQTWNQQLLSGSVFVTFILEQESVFGEPRDSSQS